MCDQCDFLWLQNLTHMPYSQFTTITKVKEAFNLSTIEGIRFLPEIAPKQLGLQPEAAKEGCTNE